MPAGAGWPGCVVERTKRVGKRGARRAEPGAESGAGSGRRAGRRPEGARRRPGGTEGDPEPAGNRERAGKAPKATQSRQTGGARGRRSWTGNDPERGGGAQGDRSAMPAADQARWRWDLVQLSPSSLDIVPLEGALEASGV